MELKRLKLNNIASGAMEKSQMNRLRGGGCGCPCYYAETGGSSVDDNAEANYKDYGHDGGPSYACWEVCCCVGGWDAASTVLSAANPVSHH